MLWQLIAYFNSLLPEFTNGRIEGSGDAGGGLAEAMLFTRCWRCCLRTVYSLTHRVGQAMLEEASRELVWMDERDMDRENQVHRRSPTACVPSRTRSTDDLYNKSCVSQVQIRCESGANQV